MLWGSICLMLVLKHLEQVLNYRTIASAIHKPNIQFLACLIWVLKNLWNLADTEFGRVQARNMLQHLWTGPISNAAVDVVQGSKSVEVRPIGVSKVSIHSHCCFWSCHNLEIFVPWIKICKHTP